MASINNHTVMIDHYDHNTTNTLITTTKNDCNINYNGITNNAEVSIPRLTDAIRRYSYLSGELTHNNNNTIDSTVPIIIRLLREREQNTNNNKSVVAANDNGECSLYSEISFSWSELTQLSIDVATCVHGKQTADKIEQSLREIYSMTAKILDDAMAAGGLDQAAIFFFRLFLYSSQIDKQQGEKIRNTFGPYPPSIVTKLAQTIQSVLQTVPQLKDMLDSSNNVTNNRTAPSEVNGDILSNFDDFINNKPFAADLGFCGYTKENLLPQEEFPQNYIDEFSCTKNTTKMNGTSQINGESDEKLTTVENSVQENSEFGPLWLLEQCHLILLSDKAKEACAICIDLLSGPDSSELIAEPLLNCLGMERFEFVQYLLENRIEICRTASPQLFHLSSSSYAQVSKKKSRGPTVAGNIVIHSQQEKDLMKQIRKDKKFEQKNTSKTEDGTDLFYFDLNPKILRAQREMELSEARKRPILSGNRQSYAIHTEIYPHVYDHLDKSTLNATLINNCRIVLPLDTERTNNERYESVMIPAYSNNEEYLKSFNLIKISSLDDLAKSVFTEEQHLNIIQSVVFETAYHTNENLLICAPTGAGKTNIALLTILRAISLYWTKGQTKLEEFKIIYVAPMKALAAEIVRKFSARLQSIGLSVREFTGDMQLNKQEIKNTHVIVTTPEKWDVVTRKSTGDVSLALSVKLLIMDEVHLLHEDRGPVLESLVARTIRQIETTQKMIRLVGLSATLPNYLDVGRFLQVNPYKGLFYFDRRFRPVPLKQTFMGVKGNKLHQNIEMDHLCYDRTISFLKQNEQVMVFVHSRNATVKTAEFLKEQSRNAGHSSHFRVSQSPALGNAGKQIVKCHYYPLKSLFPEGICVHHAGMPRKDRTLVEDLFKKKLIKVLVCTSTLAWGVNLPAHAVIIKGTTLYDAQKCEFVDLGILDVLQIFGRAGRPQFDKTGDATIITNHDKLNLYLALLTRQNPIESKFIERLEDNLNAEVVLGTVTTVEEAVQWLKYTYLYIRMYANPLAYGIKPSDCDKRITLENYCYQLITKSANTLDKYKMLRYDENTTFLNATNLGRTASYFYIRSETIELISKELIPHLDDIHLLSLISRAKEFDQIKVREEEIPELKALEDDCQFKIMGGPENSHGKISILLQSYVSRIKIETHSLTNDTYYISQNAGRIFRGLFDIALRKGWPRIAATLLTFSKCVELQLWPDQHPLLQFTGALSAELIEKLDDRASQLTIDNILEMDAFTIGQLIRHAKMGELVKECAEQFPNIGLKSSIQPITRTVLRVKVTITSNFKWSDRYHGNSQSWWLWVEDSDNDHIYYSELVVLTKKQVRNKEDVDIVFTIPIFEPIPTQYMLRAISEHWLGSETVEPIYFKHLILPESYPPHTELLDIQPLPKKVLKNADYEALYSYSHFNPIQSQVFHSVYHSDQNILLGAPTGSGKTVIAELAILRMFNCYPESKCVYIAPLKALVRERINDWKERLERRLSKSVVELTGDVMPDIRSIEKADVIVTTPEKWDAVSRSWSTRSYVRSVVLMVIDEIHLLGEDRGPVLEVIVSRTNFISNHTDQKMRIIGLSTALANARDLAEWLGIKPGGLFNFKPSVRPVPLEAHITGFSGKHYCPRMATMNKPTYRAIVTYSPTKPVLVFVSSRRQTRLTAIDLISYVASEGDPKRWFHLTDGDNWEELVQRVEDGNLKHFLEFGIGVHHAGLHENDRNLCEKLFCEQKIQILIATSTLAWGVNFPAHLVVIKGTEFYDGKLKRYVDFPITDVLQMMGRAGRPQYDDQGVAVILVHDIKKDFYKKFLYEPFPVESCLLEVLPDHLNAEIVGCTLLTRQDCIDYLTWTFFFRRIFLNPTYYKLDGTDESNINTYLSSLVDGCLTKLQSANCLQVEEDGTIKSLHYGRVCSYYYLKHGTIRMFKLRLSKTSNLPDLLTILCDTQEYAELPVRHNEDAQNKELAETLPITIHDASFESPHFKAHLLYQSHFSRSPLPIVDYYTDRKSVLDQSFRILQAMLDIVAAEGWLAPSLSTMILIQMVTQACWITDSSLLMIPYIKQCHLHLFTFVSPGGDKVLTVSNIAELLAAHNRYSGILTTMLKSDFTPNQIMEMVEFMRRLPTIRVEMSIKFSQVGSTEPQTVPSYTATENTIHQLGGGESHILCVTLEETAKRGKYNNRAATPRLAKPKNEIWWLVVGEISSNTLIAMKKVSLTRSTINVSILFTTPPKLGHRKLTLYLISDSYIGLDQQYDIRLEIINNKTEENQVN